MLNFFQNVLGLHTYDPNNDPILVRRRQNSLAKRIQRNFSRARVSQI